MRALTYHGSRDVRVEQVPDPSLIAADDIILRVTATAICGSDLHIYRGKIPAMEHGDILGHEFMGIVEEAGPGVTRVKVGDRVGPDTTVCIVEAMKVFNEIPAEVSGRIVAVLAQSGDPVEFNQPLFRVEPN